MAIALVLIGTTAFCGKPSYIDPYTQTLVYLGNGYPSGEHFNLNVISKKENYNCTTPEPTDGEYGNVIFIPENATDLKILMESGKKGPKSNLTATSLEGSDACAGFGGAGDSGVLRLPAHGDGYAVFARAVGTPSEEGFIRIFDPGIEYVAAYDASSDPLFFLGVVSADGVFTSTEEVFFRGGGKSVAREITDLFMWQGQVCYPYGLPDTYDMSSHDFAEECCSLIYNDDGDAEPDLVDQCGLWEWDADLGQDVCNFTEMPCVTYETPTWVFNIADVVDYFWTLDNNGIKNLKIRFYPLPIETQPWVKAP
jgi:hypothetical protein